MERPDGLRAGRNVGYRIADSAGGVVLWLNVWRGALSAVRSL